MYEASERDYRIIAIKDAISGIYEQGINEMLNIGISVLHSAEFTEMSVENGV
jgi:hypothetical protein